jgi:hypothetical protein
MGHHALLVQLNAIFGTIVEKVYLDCADEEHSWTETFRGQLLACSGESKIYQRAGDGRIVLYYPDARTLFVLDAVHELNHYFDTSEHEQVMRAIIGPSTLPSSIRERMHDARVGLWQ